MVGPWLIVRRLAAWFGCLASAERAIEFSPTLLRQLATVLEEAAGMLPDPEDGAI
jgi:hypothetical protein